MQRTPVKCSEFINQVKNMPWLWNSKDPDYNMSEKCEKSWEELGQILICSGHAAQNRWKYLLEEFRQEIYKVPVEHRINVPDVYNSDWTHFRSLFFLFDEVMKSSNIKETTPKSWTLYVGDELVEIEETTNDAFMTMFPRVSDPDAAPQFGLYDEVPIEVCFESVPLEADPLFIPEGTKPGTDFV